MFAPVYFDHNATTPLDPRVLDAMLPYLREQFGNASSRHEYGRAARRAIDEARQRVAYAVGAHPTEVVFTSGGSEANNLFLKGAAACLAPGTVAISAIEHPCVREPAKALQRAGWKLREIAVDENCRVAGADFLAACAEKPALVSVMLANNETGAVQDVAALAAQAKSARAWFHTDAVQAFGKRRIDFRALNGAGVHALTLSAHKLGGPKGAGALVVDKRVELQPLIAGGGHERGLRSGTENVAAIVGFGLAAELASGAVRRPCQAVRGLACRTRSGPGGAGGNGFRQRRGTSAEHQLLCLRRHRRRNPGRQAGSRRVCRGGRGRLFQRQPEPSRVLLAMGVPSALARGAVRISFGVGNGAAQVGDFLAALNTTILQLKGLRALTS
jgi:cysteine desulfurase